MWYSKLFRRHLLDMHIEDWSEEFLSGFSPEVYVKNLKNAHVNYAMIYLQSHVGLCYYPTKTGVMHKALEKDPALLKKTVELCQREGIRVCGYYSLIHNTREHDRHPDWRILTENGKSKRENRSNTTELDFASAKGARYGLLCPNHPEYIAFVEAQIDEMLSYFPLDALFFDMPFWPHTCYCEHCQRDYEKTTGRRLPLFSSARYSELSEEEQKEYLSLTEYKYAAMGRFVRRVSDYVKNKRPEMPVEHNYASGIAASSFAGCGEEVASASDYVGGDLYGDLYNHSFACKYYKNITNNPPFEQMFSRCKPALQMHTLTKTTDEMKIALGSTMAHHGATLVIDAVDPVGTMDERLYSRLGELFSFQEPYERYFRGEMAEDLGIFYSVRSNQGSGASAGRDCCIALCCNLIRSHVPLGVAGAAGDFSRFQAVMAPMLSSLEKKGQKLLEAYVRDGGLLYLSGCEDPTFVERMTGNCRTSQTTEQKLYLSPAEGSESCFCGFSKKYPLPYDGTAPVVQAGKNARVLATFTFPYTRNNDLRFASIHSDPPGIPSAIPAITANPLGKGWVLWSAVPVEVMKHPEHTQVIFSLLRSLKELTPSFMTNAPEIVELTLFRDGKEKLLHCSLLAEVTKAFVLPPFTVKVRCEKKPKAVLLAPEEAPVPFTYKDGYAVFESRPLHIFDTYRIVD